MFEGQAAQQTGSLRVFPRRKPIDQRQSRREFATLKEAVDCRQIDLASAMECAVGSGCLVCCPGC